MDTLEPQAVPTTGTASALPTGKFLRNTWYPIMWSSDLVGEALVPRVALEEPIVFFRRQDGTPAAIADICSHRFAPLHLGKRCGDRIQCGYHGLEFDASGACARNPFGEGKIPAASSVRSYPLAEKHAIIWIWMGNRAADPALIPDFSIFDNPAPGTLTKFDSITMAANYELITDNLMDLNHTAFLHEGLLGHPSQSGGTPPEVRQEGNTVYVTRYNRNVPAVKVYDLLYRQDGKPFDFWDTMRWDAPGCFLLDTGVHAPGLSKENGTGIFAVHLLTPQTLTSTNYLFSAVRQGVENGQPPTPEIAAEIGNLRRFIFTSQDTLMIEAQQQVLTNYPHRTTHPALFSIDAGPARYKRVLRALLDADAS